MHIDSDVEAGHMVCGTPAARVQNQGPGGTLHTTRTYSHTYKHTQLYDAEVFDGHVYDRLFALPTHTPGGTQIRIPKSKKK